MRITKADLEGTVCVVNFILKEYGYNHRIELDYTYRQPCIIKIEADGSKAGRLSPIARSGIIFDWLHAFRQGLRIGLKEPARSKSLEQDPTPPSQEEMDYMEWEAELLI